MGFQSLTSCQLQKNTLCFITSGRRELNPRPLGPEPSALPSALLPVIKKAIYLRKNKKPQRTWRNTESLVRKPYLLCETPSYPQDSSTPWLIPNSRIASLSRVTGLEPAISGVTGQRDRPTSLHPQCFINILKIAKLVK